MYLFLGALLAGQTEIVEKNEGKTVNKAECPRNWGWNVEKEEGERKRQKCLFRLSLTIYNNIHTIFLTSKQETMYGAITQH